MEYRVDLLDEGHGLNHRSDFSKKTKYRKKFTSATSSQWISGKNSVNFSKNLLFGVNSKTVAPATHLRKERIQYKW